MRLLLSGGGTGGHVYPILAIIEELLAGGQETRDLLFVGLRGGVEERLAGQMGVGFACVECGQMRGRDPMTMARSLGRLRRGMDQSRRIIASFRPQAVLSTGGYVGAPALLAAWRMGVPALIYLPDIVPGVTIKLLSRLARQVAVSFEETLGAFPPGKAFVSGYPVRRALHVGDRLLARQRLGLRLDVPVVLAFGGSQGSHNINAAVLAQISELALMTQVIHITGSGDIAEVRQARQDLPAEVQGRYQVHEYLHGEMADALWAADLVVARAGASTLGEFPAVGVPSLLVPYPYSGQHQYANARYMERQGAALVLEDADLAGQLARVVRHVLLESEVRQRMVERSRALCRPDAAANIVLALRRLAGE